MVNEREASVVLAPTIGRNEGSDPGTPAPRRAAAWRRVRALAGALALLAGVSTLAACGSKDLVSNQTQVASVTVAPNTASVAVGGNLALQATAFTASGTVMAGAPFTWQSLSPAVAAVSTTGLVTGLSAGTAVIVASSGERQGQATVTVRTSSTGGGPSGGSGSINVNLAGREQTIVGWEAGAQADQGSAPYPLYRDTLLGLAVSDLGINRLRIEVPAGIEDTINYYALRNSLPEGQWNCLRYQTVKTSPPTFHFEELDSTIEELALPMKRLVEARGEHLWLNFDYIAFACTGKGYPYIHTNPSEYAFFAQSVLQHVQQKYGLVPDSWEVMLEPDNSTPWKAAGATVLGQALAATATQLAAAGLHPDFIGPSTESASAASAWFDTMMAVPGVPGNLKELSYHRYINANSTTIAAIGQRTIQYGVRSAMTEEIGASYNELIQDLLTGRVSAWQQFALAWPTTDNGGQYYTVDLTNPAHPVVHPGDRTRYLRQFFHYVRAGAVVVDATATVGGITPVAFVNTNGKAVVVVRAASAVTFTVAGLPAGTYGIHYTTAAATDAPAADQTITAGQLVQATIPAAGILTIFAR